MSSNTGMNTATTTEALEQRITELEIKASFSEDLLDHLNEIVAKQAQQIELLARELVELKAQRVTPDGGITVRSLREELPPHY